MLTERLVSVIEHGLTFARVPEDPGPEVVADGPLRHASPKLVHVHVATQPGALLHVQHRPEVSVIAERKHTDGQVDLGDLAG